MAIKTIGLRVSIPTSAHERGLYMKIPKGYQVQDAKSKDYVLKLNNNIYGQKQAGRVWNQFLTGKLVKGNMINVFSTAKMSYTYYTLMTPLQRNHQYLKSMKQSKLSRALN